MNHSPTAARQQDDPISKVEDLLPSPSPRLSDAANPPCNHPVKWPGNVAGAETGQGAGAGGQEQEKKEEEQGGKYQVIG